MRRAQKSPLAIMEVETAVFMSSYFPAPKKVDTITEHPMLHPNAKAMKIRVIS